MMKVPNKMNQDAGKLGELLVRDEDANWRNVLGCVLYGKSRHSAKPFDSALHPQNMPLQC